jgi:hypothetical protein
MANTTIEIGNSPIEANHILDSHMATGLTIMCELSSHINELG